MKCIINNILLQYYHKYSFNITRKRTLCPLDKQCAICDTKFIKMIL